MQERKVAKLRQTSASEQAHEILILMFKFIAEFSFCILAKFHSTALEGSSIDEK